MKKSVLKSGLMSSLIGLSSLSVYAAPEMDFGAELRLRNENRTMEQDSTQNRRNRTQMRARMTFDAKVNENLNFHIAPQATKYYGEVINTANNAGTTNRLSSGDQYHSSVDLFEAYAKGKRGKVEYKLGRQALGYGDNIILGTRNWTAGGLSYDAVKFTVPAGGESKLDLVYAQISQGTTATEVSDDVMLTILYYKALTQEDLLLDVYAFNNDDRASQENIFNLGFRLKGKLNKLDFRTENIAQTNSKMKDNTESNFNVEVGYKLNDPLRVYIGFSQASANFSQMYTNRHRYNGIIDMVGRRNMNTYEVGASYKANSDLSFSLQYFMFTRKDKKVAAYKQNGKAYTGATVDQTGKEEEIGSEIDFITKYKLSKNEKLTLALSQFKHGDYFQGDIDTSTFVFVEYGLKF